MDAHGGSPPGEASGGAENTEPLPVLTPAGHPVTGPLPMPTPQVPTTLPPYDFTALDMSRAPVGRKRWLALAGGALAAVAAIGVVAVVVARPDDAPAAPAAPDSARDPAAEARLTARLPDGYPPDACELVEPPRGTLAQLQCSGAGDPSTRPGATFILFEDQQALTAAFQRMLKGSSIVVCPGRIQSPGPWRRNATPEVVSGTVFCGTSQDTAVVGWTDEASLLLSEIRSPAGQRNLEQLFEWWSGHS